MMDIPTNRKAGKTIHQSCLQNNKNSFSIVDGLPVDNRRVPTLSTHMLQPNNNLKIAGRLQHFKHEWRKLTSDPEIMDMINGMSIPFVDKIPVQTKLPRQIPMSKEESKAVDKEVQNLLDDGVIVPTVRTGVDYFSNIFTRPKPNGSYRVILNLKHFNDYVEKVHFKMETVQNAISLMQPFCYMGSLDLSQAYYVIPLKINHRRFLKFQWNNNMYMYVTCPMGITCGPRKFSKLLKPVFATLRSMGYIFVGYIDDSWNCAVEKEVCRQGLIEGNNLFTRVGFIVNPEKSVFEPTQRIEFLGLILDSIMMMIFLTQKKTEKIIRLCEKYITKTRIKIRDLAKLIGNLVAALPAAQYGKMHYRTLEVCKINALKENAFNWDAKCTIGYQEHAEMQWWLDNVSDIRNPIWKGSIELTMSTDACDYQWGCFCQGESALNYFSVTEQGFHINVKELLAIKYSLRCFQDKVCGKHVLIQCDNTTAIKYVKDMGGTGHGLMNQIAKDLWTWCEQNQIWLSITHIAGVLNSEADSASRTEYNPRTEWALKQNVFDSIVRKMGPVDIDLFASNLNNKLPRYVSWVRDPYSEHVDAFTLNWTGLNVYIFPPFSLMSRVVQKLLHEPVRNAVIIIPDWKTQPWYPLITERATKIINLPRRSVYQPVVNLKNPNVQRENMPAQAKFLAVQF